MLIPASVATKETSGWKDLELHVSVPILVLGSGNVRAEDLRSVEGS